MTPSRVSIARTFVLTALALASTACGKDSGPAADLPSFQDVSSASPAIQQAARAVVLIETAGEYASGSFVSATGLLLTNNHVLGVSVCPIEGCHPLLTFLHQRGETKQEARSVFAVPVAVDVGLDMALVQVYEGDGLAPLSTPDFLTLESHSAPALLGTHITTVGHPEANLKKWTSGSVIDSDGHWIWTDAYSLPGDSGSPYLNDAGKMVGILHRGPSSQDLFTATGANEYSIGTASDALIAAMKAPLPSAMISATVATTAADVVTNDRVYLNAKVAAVPATDGTTIDVLSALGDACDAGLARTDYASPEDLSSALTPCTEAELWIECRADAQPGFAFVCPAAADTSTWISRWQAVNAHWRALNGEMSLGPVTFGVASTASSMASGISAGSSALLSTLSAAGAPIDHDVAYYLSVFAVPSYAGTATVDYVSHYGRTRDYGLGLSDFSSATTWLMGNGMMTRDAGTALLQQMAADPAIDVGASLHIESIEYDWNIIQ